MHFFADSAKFQVPKDKYFNMNDSSISLYKIYKNQGTFPGDF